MYTLGVRSEVIIFTTSLLARPIKFTGVFVSFNKSPLNKTRITYQYWISGGLNYNYFPAALEEQASRLTEAVAVFRIQQQQQQQREASAVVKTVTPATPRKMAVADSEENWETF